MTEGIYGSRVCFNYECTDGTQCKISYAHPEPKADNGEDLQWYLLHSDKPLSRAERLRVAGVLGSYAYMINGETNQTRNKKVNAIKRVIKEASDATEI